MEWFVFGVDDAIDVEEFILPTGEGDPAWILLDELNPEDDGCWRPNIEVAVAPSLGCPKLKLFGSPILRLFAGDDNELNEAIVNDGITGVIPDDSAEGDGTMDGEDVTWVGIKDPIVVGVDDNGDMIKPPSWGDVNIRVAPGTGTWPETAAWFIDQGVESLLLFVLVELGVTSDARWLADEDLTPWIPEGKVESIALIESDCLPDGCTEETGKFVNGTSGAWNRAEKRIKKWFIVVIA